MTQIEALRRLRELKAGGFETRDAAALFGTTIANTHMILRRLAAADFIVHIARGSWGLVERVSRFSLPQMIAAPYLAYVSLQSALFHHGLIEQVPAVVYAVTLGRTRRCKTPMATVSLHHLPPALFHGYEPHEKDGSLIATPEKALFDLLYLAPGRSRLFARLPELEIPRGFRWTELKGDVARVKSASRRTFLSHEIEELRSRSRDRALA
jgi:predicted transcriptional regulator of viral defense system